MAQLEGTIASRGYAYGQAFLLRDGPLVLNPEPIPASEREQEKRRLHRTLQDVRKQIRDVQDKAESFLDPESLQIFQSYQLLLEDEEFVQAIEEHMDAGGVSAAWAVHEVMEQHVAAISRMENAYLRERATDIRDLQQRILKDLLGTHTEKAPDLKDRILVAEDLSPAQSVQMNLQTLQGLLTDRGGITSHTSILARALNIPAIVGTRCATHMIRDQDWILMDAVSNKVWVNPDADLVQSYEIARESQRQEQQRLAALIHEPACTRDGTPITLAANVGLPAEIARAKSQGAEGIGLFRTEFLFMNRTDLPSEEEQFSVYKSAAESMAPHAVIIRTMDIGGDKDLPQLELPVEENPFLGFRGIRISLRRRELFKTQLRALYRAAAFGSIKIMFPMVSSVEEMLEIHEVLAEVRSRLPGCPVVEIGIMIETPASVMIADHLIRHVDFFSLGTNDLTQYTLAVDRGNVEIRDLYQPLAPAVLQMMHRAIEAAMDAGKWAGVCGELAGDPMAALLLVGLGATELSMSAGSICRVKEALRKMGWEQLKEMSDQALLCATVSEVKALLELRGQGI